VCSFGDLTHDPGIATGMLYQLSYRNSITGCLLVNSFSLRFAIFLSFPLSPFESFTLTLPHRPISHHFMGQMQPAFPSSLERHRDSFTSIFVCTQGQETYTLWRICHVIPSQSPSQRSPWSHWTPKAKVRQHQLKSLRPHTNAVMGSFLSCADIFPISIPHISDLMPWGLKNSSL